MFNCLFDPVFYEGHQTAQSRKPHHTHKNDQELYSWPAKRFVLQMHSFNNDKKHVTPARADADPVRVE